jgi:hypothetical protein
MKTMFNINEERFECKQIRTSNIGLVFLEK